MQAFNEVVNGVVNQNQTTSHSSKLCPYCKREVTAIEVEILGRKRWVQPVCQCEHNAKKEEINKFVKAKEENEVRELFSISNICDKYLKASFENFEMRQGAESAYKIAKHHAEHFKEYGFESIMLWGEPGNGKTHLAAAVHNQLIAQNKVVVFISMPELLGKIKATFNRNNKETEQQILKALNICDLLIIDDLGAEKTSDWVQETLFTIIDGRYRRQKPILATSNIEPSKLKDQIGKRAYDRILEMSQPIENKATSYRREIAKQRMSKYNEILEGEMNGQSKSV